MHQSHNIPWHLLAAHFEHRLTYCNRQKNPHSHNFYINSNHNNNTNCPFVHLRPFEKPTQTSDLVFFCARFIRALTAFSTTARAKHLLDSDNPLISTDRLLLTAFRKRDENHARYAGMSVDRYREALDAGDLPMRKWLHGDGPVPVIYASFEAGADVTKALLDEGCGGEQRGGEEEMGWEILLRMVREEKRMGAGMVLGSVTYGQSHQQGWRVVGEMALEGYMLVNTIMDVPGLMQDEGGVVAWKRWDRIRSWCHCFAKDNNTQMLPHAEFWRAVGVLEEDCFSEVNDEKMASVDLFQDMDRVQEYLKKCWRLMYGCDLLMKECGIDPDWAGLLSRQFMMKLDESKIKTYLNSG